MCWLKVVSMKEQNPQKMMKMIPKEKCCIVLLENFYTDFTYNDRFFFLDALSKRKGSSAMSNCILLDRPSINEIKASINIAINDHGCNAISIDNIFALLSYHRRDEILLFVNEVKCMGQKSMLFNIARNLNSDEEARMFQDLRLIADEIIMTL